MAVSEAAEAYEMDKKQQKALLMGTVVFWLFELWELGMVLMLALGFLANRFAGLGTGGVVGAVCVGVLVEMCLSRLCGEGAGGELPRVLATANALRGAVYALPPFIAMAGSLCADLALAPSVVCCAVSLALSLALTYRIWRTWRHRSATCRS